MKQPRINLFFACDDLYVPFLGVTLLSIKETRDTTRAYDLRVLHTGIAEASVRRLTQAFDEEDFHLTFHDISATVQTLCDRFHTRDYYTKSTYYRLFIPNLFPELSRALYLDCDIVLCDDVAKLYDTDLEGLLVGAVADGFVQSVPTLYPYVEQRIGVARDQYFNAGVLLMDLDALRRAQFEEVFLRMLEQVTFTVAQDQDYLNRICRDRCRLLDDAWNTMPNFERQDGPAKLVHYNLDSKPWHKDGLPFADLFWSYADRSPYAEQIRSIRASYTEELIRITEEQTKGLMENAIKQAQDAEENARIARVTSDILCANV